MAGVKVIANDTEFQPELSAAGSRLAVVKFTMRGCGPCLRIAPAFNALSNKYPQATFLEVDVHQCQGTAATNNISATPTFLFFRNKVRIDQYQGADAAGLEEKIKQHLENDPGNNEDADIPKGYMDLLPFVNKAGCECLNESDEHGFENCLRKDSSYLESDCDEQLLITVAFTQPVKLYSMKLQGPDNGQGPKSIKIFTNLPRSMDFEEAERSEPTQALQLGPDDIRDDGVVQLRYVKFQNVNSVTVSVPKGSGTCRESQLPKSHPLIPFLPAALRAVQPRRRGDDADHLLHVHRHAGAGHQHERLQTGSWQERREPLGRKRSLTPLQIPVFRFLENRLTLNRDFLIPCRVP